MGPDRRQQLLRFHVLEAMGDRSRRHRLHQAASVGNRSEHDHADSRMGGADPPDGLEGVDHGDRQVQQYDVRARRVAQRQRLEPGADAADELDVGGTSEQVLEPSPADVVAVGQEDADGETHGGHHRGPGPRRTSGPWS
jgi:hypothetical protein